MRLLGEGIPGGWLDGGAQLSVLRLRSLASTGDTAELLVLDAATGEVVADRGWVRAEPRHGAGGWIGTKRDPNKEMVLIDPQGVERITGVDAFPIGFVSEQAIATAVLDESTPLVAVPCEATGPAGPGSCCAFRTPTARTPTSPLGRPSSW